ncbi:AcvB/VirJ family lysyl-phosphatidylglycerol hydrolase [Sphingomonas sp. ZB1N12]|uniref:AcvB/VirJ family lysyl-phosphatidylglycerol hydrolase n=1 Tax=Sphingomonas arabinosi TaxID=3096160 RepID=UPI002FC98509
MTWFRRSLLAFAVLAIAATGFMGWLGYFGGQLFTDVPAITSPAKPRRPFAAVLLTGDLGYKIGMAPQIARRLAADGVPVVAVNTLTYLRKTRTPADITMLIARAEQRALRFGQTDRVVLIGQSFGADMLHVGLVDLAPQLRAKIAKVALIVPENTVQFRASPSEVFDYWTPTTDAVPTARRLDWAPLLCVQGVEETESLCPLLTQANARRVALPGGHPLHRDADALYDVLSRFVFAD